MAGLRLDLSQPQRRLHELSRDLRKVESGQDIKRELVRGLRKEAQPARQAVRQAIRSMPSHSRGVRESLRKHVAQRITIAAKPQGNMVGVRIVAKKAKVRGFTQAPKRLNEPSWRHPLFGNKAKWYSQIGKPGWFDDTLRDHARQFDKAASDAMDKAAEAIARKV